MREADRRTIAAGTPGIVLMERAGLAVARAAMQLAGWPRPVAILCGPGNNGGDGFIAARLLRDAGWPVRLGLLGELTNLRGDAALAAQRWDGPVEPADRLDPDEAGLIIDALFGSGLTRDLGEDAAGIVARANLSGKPVLAVDLPSGLDSDTGRVRGAAIKAAATVTFAAMKPCHVLMPGRDMCGSISVAEIGIDAATLDAVSGSLWLDDPALWRRQFPTGEPSQHKYRRGHALILGGPASSLSAARLAAHAALASGAGLVTLAVREVEALAGGHPQAVMQRVAPDAAAFADLLTDTRRNAVLIGPGAGVDASTRLCVEQALASRRACVLDADALTCFADDPGHLFARITTTTNPIVLTPHAGEFARLFGRSDADKLTQARDAAQRSGSVLIFKGPDTVIAAPDGRAAINRHAPPALASAGTGDVLAGIVTGLLAQGMPGFEAACAAVWLHGDAGYRAGAALIADDLPRAIQAARAGLIT
jgi:NAD(P)H-hydrate epimerase